MITLNLILYPMIAFIHNSELGEEYFKNKIKQWKLYLNKYQIIINHASIFFSYRWLVDESESRDQTLGQISTSLVCSFSIFT